MSKDQKILRAIIFNEFWNRMACYGILTFLVLHLCIFFKFSDSKSYTYYSLFTAFSFGSTLLGGIFADRLIGTKQAILMGGFFLITGNLFLLSSHIIVFVLGLGFVITGMGLSRGNSQSLLAIAYKDTSPSSREKMFTMFYAYMNIGAMFGPIIMALATELLNWQWGFFINIIGICCGLINFCIHFKTLPQNKKNWCSKTIMLIFLSLSCFILSVLYTFQHVYFFDLLLIAIIIFGLSTFVRIFLNTDKTDKQKIYTIFLLNIFCICFFASSLQLGSSIAIFLSRNTYISSSFHFSNTNVFNAMNPFFVALLAPLFIFFWKFIKKIGFSFDVWGKIAIGLGFATLSFITLLCIPKIHSPNVITLIILANFFLGAGEVCLSPTILATIGQLAPRNLQGTLMGLWYLSLAFAGYLSGNLAKLGSSAHTISYRHEFKLILILNGVMAIIACFISKAKYAFSANTVELKKI